MINTIEKIETYMANNKLKLNTDKTKLMVLSKKPSRRMEIQIPTEDQPIKHSNKVKILGVEIDHTLNWKKKINRGSNGHHQTVKNKSQLTQIIKKKSSEAQMRMFASGIYMSKLEYGAEVWSSARAYIIKSLQSTQLEAARTVLGPRSRQW